MTTPPNIERDTNGRFVKVEAERPSLPINADPDAHPVARFLFGWVENRRTPMLLLAVTAFTVLALTLIDFGIARHEKVEQANANGFYAIWGFCGFALAVLSGWPLGKLLRRSEDFYGEADTTPSDVEADQ